MWVMVSNEPIGQTDDQDQYEQDLVTGILAVLRSPDPATELDDLTVGGRIPASILAALASHGEQLRLDAAAALDEAEAEGYQRLADAQQRDDNIGIALDLIWEAEQDPRLMWDQIMDGCGAGVTHTSVLDALARYGASVDAATRARLTGQLPTEENDTTTS